MSNLAKNGQQLNGHERKIFLKFWLRESLRHLRRPSGLKGICILRSLKGSYSTTPTGWISTLFSKIGSKWPAKKICLYICKGINGKFSILEFSAKILANEVDFWKVEYIKNSQIFYSLSFETLILLNFGSSKWNYLTQASQFFFLEHVIFWKKIYFLPIRSNFIWDHRYWAKSGSQSLTNQKIGSFVKM